MLPESTFRKAEHIISEYSPRKLLLIGDDDLLSIAVNMIDDSIEIDIVEIDEELCKFIAGNMTSTVCIRVINKSIFDSVGDIEHGAYDLVVAESISSYGAMFAFVSKAASVVINGGYIIVPPVSNAYSRSIANKVVHELGLEFISTAHRYGNYMNEYYDIAGFNTDLMIVRKGKSTSKNTLQAKDVMPNVMQQEFKDLLYDYDIEICCNPTSHLADHIDQIESVIKRVFVVKNIYEHVVSSFFCITYYCSECLIYLFSDRTKNIAILHVRSFQFIERKIIDELIPDSALLKRLTTLPRFIS